MALSLLFFFALGAIIASFMGVVGARLNTGEGVIRGRSRCDACGRVLAAFDLVPLAGFARSRARCCSARISRASALGELMLGVLYALTYLSLGTSLLLPLALAALALLYALVRYDFAHQILPARLLYPFLALALAYSYLAATNLLAFEASLTVALALAAFLFALYLLSRGRAMGFADAPLCFALALFAAPRALSGFAYSFWIGALVGIILVGARKGVRMKSEVPLAPFLAAGFLLAYFLPWDPFAPLTALL